MITQTHDTKTFVDVLLAASGNDRQGYNFLDRKLADDHWSFAKIVAEAQRRARYLRHCGCDVGDRVLLVMEDSREFVLTFFAAVLAGVVPVPIYPPRAFGNPQRYAETTRNACQSVDPRFVLCTEAERAVLNAVLAELEIDRRLLCMDEAGGGDHPWPPFPAFHPQEDDLCFIQFTSGSTSLPKGVMVTHGGIVANARAMMVEALRVDNDVDCGVSWLPLFHDMGLVGFVLAPVLVQTSVVFLPTAAFVRRPWVWMSTVSKYRGTISFAPNFGFALATLRAAAEGLDLSCMRVLGCGAEPIQSQTLEAFADKFAPAGLAAAALMPSYGLAESTLAVAFSTGGLRSIRVRSEVYQKQGVVEVVDGRGPGTSEWVSCGQSFVGHRVCIVAPDGSPLPADQVGEIVVAGPSVCAGYYRNPEATAALRCGDGIRTGDLGFMHDGDLFVTGRSKDTIIVRGRNFEAHALEWEAQAVPGVRQGGVAAFAVSGATGEHVVVVLEGPTSKTDPLSAAVVARLQSTLGILVESVIVVRPGTLAKTSSGKIQRNFTKAQYLDGAFDRTGAARTAGPDRAASPAGPKAGPSPGRSCGTGRPTIDRRTASV